MLDMKETFVAALRAEPSMRATVDSVAVGARRRERHRRALAAASGVAVAAVAATVLMTLAPAGPESSPPLSPGGDRTGAPTGDAPIPVGPLERATGTPTPRASWTPGNSAADQVVLAHFNEFDHIQAAIVKRFTDAGYLVKTVSRIGARPVSAQFPRGEYQLALSMSQGGHDGVVLVAIGMPGAPARPASTSCALRGGKRLDCRLITTGDGRRGIFDSGSVSPSSTTVRPGKFGRALIIWTDDYTTAVQYVGQGSNGKQLDLTLPDDFMQSIATDPALTLAGVPALTQSQADQLQSEGYVAPDLSAAVTPGASPGATG